MAALVAEAVSKVFEIGSRRVTALEEFTLTVHEREFVCLVGASGCGKTTFLKLAAGFLPVTSGRILVAGEPVTTVHSRCVIVFQDYALFPWKTARKNIEFALQMRRLPAREWPDIVSRILKMVHLEGFENLYPRELSGGMQQRVALARALASDAPVLLMDEPFAALDAMTRSVLQQELLRIHEASGKAIVFVTHNIEEALVLADRIVVMRANPGRIFRVFQNPLPRPRTLDVMTGPAFGQLRREIWDAVSIDLEVASGKQQGG